MKYAERVGKNNGSSSKHWQRINEESETKISQEHCIQWRKHLRRSDAKAGLQTMRETGTCICIGTRPEGNGRAGCYLSTEG